MSNDIVNIKMKFFLVTLLVALLIITLLFFICDKEPSTPEDIDTLIVQLFHPELLESPSNFESLAEVISKSEAPAWSHDDRQAVIKNYKFSGMTISAYFPDTTSINGFVTQIEITGRQWPLSNNLKVGESVEVFRKKFGLDKDVPLKICGMNNCLTAEHSDGHVTKFLLDYYLD